MAAPIHSAVAEDLLSFTFSDLEGDFFLTDERLDVSWLFTAADDSDTDGDVTRLIDPIGDAIFAGTEGAGGLPGAAEFSVTMGISDFTTTTAAGDGTLQVTDVDGDVISAFIEGTWYYNGSACFIGTISGASLVDYGAQDGEFNGTDGSSFVTGDIAAGGPYEGNIVTLAMGEWFTNANGEPVQFSGATTLAAGAITPEPMTLSLLALGGLAITARRRRR